MDGINVKINKLKNESFMRLVRPCNAFLTFQCEEGVNRALQLNEIIAENSNCNVAGGKRPGEICSGVPQDLGVFDC